MKLERIEVPTLQQLLDRWPCRVVRNQCWLLPLRPASNGYAQAHWGGRNWRAHRLFYSAAQRRFLLTSQTLDHLCRNRSCVNPEHLEIVSNRTNVLRGVGITAELSRRTHCKRAGHPLSGANLIVRKPLPGRIAGSRECRQCNNECQRRWKLRRKCI